MSAQRTPARRRLAAAIVSVAAASALALSSCATDSAQQTSASPSQGGTGSGTPASGSSDGAASSGAASEGSSSAPAEPVKADETPLKFKTVEGPTTAWPDNSMVSHLFYHSLVVDPKRAFSDKESGKGYMDYMATIDEFKKQLQVMYERGYVLVSPHQLGTVNAKGKMVPNKLQLPKGKKPLVLSIDDVSYYEYMKGDGFPTKLLINDQGKVVNEYTAPGTKDAVQGAYDVMPIVDEFVEKHPDFAPYGAKGVIALTGYNGVLGYRTSDYEYKGKNKNIEADKAEATKVANALKASGWEFASHSWGHINFTKSSLGRIKEDTARWKAEVEPIVGKTDLLIYPFGADISGLPKYKGPKYDYLKDQGYNFYFNVDGSTPAWGQWGEGYLREARLNVDGLSMKGALTGKHKALETFFDVKDTVDPLRPKSISGTS